MSRQGLHHACGGVPSRCTFTNTYFSNDLVSAQGQTDEARTSWTLDPLQRRTGYTRQSWDTATAAWGQAVTKTSYYGDDTDNPAWIKEGTAADAPLTRYVAGANGRALVSTTQTGGRALLLSDLHGDVITTVPLTDGAGVDAPGVCHHSYDEFGNTRTIDGAPASPGRYAWLGAHERSTNTLGGLVLMGVRLHSAAIGRFLSVDPVPGGNATAYNYPQDPINQADTDGLRGAVRTGGKFCYCAPKVGARAGSALFGGSRLSSLGRSPAIALRARANRVSFKSVDEVMRNPQLLSGKNPSAVEKAIGDTPGWRVERLGQGSAAGRGWVLRQYTDRGFPAGPQIRYHPGGGPSRTGALLAGRWS